MEEFTSILREATEALKPEYFLLPVDGGESVFRERVYCYELYHQLRLRWPQHSPYFLNGKVDKQSHPYFQGTGRPKPDMLVHVPGTGDNYAALEVKSLQGASSAVRVRKDINTLNLLKTYGYRHTIYLIYSASSESARECVNLSGADPAEINSIDLWAHEHVGSAARMCFREGR